MSEGQRHQYEEEFLHHVSLLPYIGSSDSASWVVGGFDRRCLQSGWDWRHRVGFMQLCAEPATGKLFTFT